MAMKILVAGDSTSMVLSPKTGSVQISFGYMGFCEPNFRQISALLRGRKAIQADVWDSWVYIEVVKPRIR